MGKIEKATDDLLIKKYNDELGQKAKVFHTDVTGEGPQRGNEALREIGEFLLPQEGLEYKGSAAFHIYVAPTLKQTFFISQAVTLNEVPEMVVDAGLKTFKGALMEHFGRDRQKKRSGF